MGCSTWINICSRVNMIDSSMRKSPSNSRSKEPGWCRVYDAAMPPNLRMKMVVITWKELSPHRPWPRAWCCDMVKGYEDSSIDDGWIRAGEKEWLELPIYLSKPTLAGPCLEGKLWVIEHGSRRTVHRFERGFGGDAEAWIEIREGEDTVVLERLGGVVHWQIREGDGGIHHVGSPRHVGKLQRAEVMARIFEIARGLRNAFEIRERDG